MIVEPTEKSVLALAMSLCFVAAAPLAQDAEAVPDDTPVQVVGRLQAGIESIAREAGALSYAKRYERLVPVVAGSHDLSHVAKEVLGKGWQSLDSPQQHRFRETFARLYTAAAAARFEAPASFTAPAHESRTETLARVVSRRTEKRGKTADLEYVLHKVGARWRIIDTLEDGVSQLTDARAEFRRILEREGAPALLARLEQRLRSYGEPASKVVERLQAALLEAMKSGAELAHRVRAERLAPVIAETHDFPFIARFVVRRHWKDLSGQQRSDFVDQFRRLSVATYTSRFDSYNGEDFVLLGEKALRGGYLLVKSSLTKSDGKKVSFGYQMRKVGYRWVIVNIIVDGVSDLATKQAEYRGIIASKGFDDLVAKIEDQIQRYQSPEKK